MKKNTGIHLGLLIIRLGIGLSFAFNHGYSKISGGPDLWEKLGGKMAYLGIEFAPVFWGFMAAFAEFGGGLLLAVGLLTRPAAFLIAFTMLVAVVMHHAQGESYTYPMELMFVALGLMVSGAGKYSLDAHLPFRK